MKVWGTIGSLVLAAGALALLEENNYDLGKGGTLVAWIMAAQPLFIIPAIHSKDAR
jgi:hypothetical protein